MWTATQQGAVGSGWHRQVLGACAVRGPAWIRKKHKGDPEPVRGAPESPGVQAPRPVLAPEDKLLCPSSTPPPPRRTREGALAIWALPPGSKGSCPCWLPACGKT